MIMHSKTCEQRKTPEQKLFSFVEKEDTTSQPVIPFTICDRNRGFDGYDLVFWEGITLRRLITTPLLYELYGPVVCVTRRSTQRALVVSDIPCFSSSPRVTGFNGVTLAHVEGKSVHFEKELFSKKACLQIQKLNDCVGCSGRGRIAACNHILLENLVRGTLHRGEHLWLRYYILIDDKRRTDVFESSHTSDDDYAAAEWVYPAVYDKEDFCKFLEKEAGQHNWKFNKPGNYVGSFSPAPCELHNFDYALDSPKVPTGCSISAHAGWSTRRALVRCEKECCFFKYCNDIETYKASAKHCQSANGPYDEKVVEEIYRREVKAHNVDVEKVSFIAYNGGVTTGLFGYEMELRGMDDNMQDVVFTRYEKRADWNTRTYSYEDAVTILHTPWRENGVYHYPRITKPEDVILMPEDILHLYMEICQHDYLRSYNYYCGQAYPFINSVQYQGRAYADEFSVNVTPGRTTKVNTLQEVHACFGLGWRDKTKILTGKIARELLAKVDQETK